MDHFVDGIFVLCFCLSTGTWLGYKRRSALNFIIHHMDMIADCLSPSLFPPPMRPSISLHFHSQKISCHIVWRLAFKWLQNFISVDCFRIKVELNSISSSAEAKPYIPCLFRFTQYALGLVLPTTDYSVFIYVDKRIIWFSVGVQCTVWCVYDCVQRVSVQQSRAILCILLCSVYLSVCLCISLTCLTA